jgi:MSHA pilin protein MshA
MKTLQKQAGFTLIELVVVIVILGILAATAAPKFIDLTGDAKASVIEAVEGSLNSAADLAHAKSLVSGTTDGNISIAGTSIAFVDGWPTEDAINGLLEIDFTNGDIKEVSDAAGSFTHKDAADEANCVAVYDTSGVNSTNDRPSITSDVDGC